MIILVVVGIDLYRRRVVNEAPETHIDIAPQPLTIDPMLDFFDDNIDKMQLASTYTEPAPIPENILTITIRSREVYGFKGANLLSAIKNAHLHFGKNDVFYRYENEDGKGEALFSLVKSTEPGYFYLETLLQEHIPGIILILLVDRVNNPQLALDKMVRTAKQIAFALNAELLDDQRQTLTLETIEQYKRQAQRK